MLELAHTFSGVPHASLRFLKLPGEILLLYAAADSVLVYNAWTLSFVRTLAFWEVFPGTREGRDNVSYVATDDALKLIIASMGNQLALWCLSDVRKGAWIVHSALTLPKGQSVTSIGCTSGLLAIGSSSLLSVYTLVLEDDLPTWSKKWSSKLQASTNVRFSPSLTHLAAISPKDNSVRLFSTAAGSQIQTIRHPRPLLHLEWRDARTSSRDDLILYTVTSDATLRIFLPVIDSPQRLQLHTALDLFSSVPLPALSNASGEDSFSPSRIFTIDKDTITGSIKTIVSGMPQNSEDTGYRRLQELNDENSDFFLRVMPDKSLIVRAVANIDRRPPTFLRQFNLLHSPVFNLNPTFSHLYVLPSSTSKSLTLLTSPPLSSYEVDPLLFFDAKESGLKLKAHIPLEGEDTSKVLRFVRTPDGSGVCVIRENGSDTFRTNASGTILRNTGHWHVADHCVVFDNGGRVALYNRVNRTLTLYSASCPPTSLQLPELTSMFCLSSEGEHTAIIGITSDSRIVDVDVSGADASEPSLILHSITQLPTQSTPKMILPVDPMAWSNLPKGSGRQHDILLSLSDEGELAFWFTDDKLKTWTCTGRVRTKRSGISIARCSSAKKSALVVPHSTGEELTIWDSQESEFSSGLEFRQFYSSTEHINDLDWTSTPDLQSILAVGFMQHVDLLSQQRMTYFDQEPAWAKCARIDISGITTHSISDSIWLTGGTLLVGAGHQLFQFGRRLPPEKPVTIEGRSPELFEHVARSNGPLEDHHPQMILQCLLWGKIELVKQFIVNLSHDLERMKISEQTRYVWSRVPIEKFLEGEERPQQSAKKAKPQYNMLFNGVQEIEESSSDPAFSQDLVQQLMRQLETEPLHDLSANENAHLRVLIQTTLEIDGMRRSLDANGLRYLISMRSFYILNGEVSAPHTLDVSGLTGGQRERLRFRDIVWAFHSESQEILLGASNSACGGKMIWPDARALGVFLWLNSLESMKSHLEVIARNHYMLGDNRDPEACCVYYFALGKVKLVHGLWRQAAWHKDQTVMVKFLGNDFTEPRWRTAALKNAFVLLSKQRFELAAAFFLLGGSLKDAVNVCVKQLDDFQLAIALARINEPGDEGPILKQLLENVVIPMAFQKGNRWLGSWAFWLLRRRDVAVRILVSPLEDIRTSLNLIVSEIGAPNYDDPSLALLFSQLESKTLQAVKGTAEISGRTEFKFILQIARVFCRMGCHALALNLVKNWSFDRPTAGTQEPPTTLFTREAEVSVPRSPTLQRRPDSGFRNHVRRRSSILIDMDFPSAGPTRAPSPEPPSEHPIVPIREADEDLATRKAGFGSLMKSARQDVKVPEFDMSSFF